MYIEVLALSSPARYSLDELNEGLMIHKNIWRKHGFNARLYPSCFEQNYFESISCDEKILEFYQEIKEGDIIVALRGGYSTNFILRDLDYTHLTKNKRTIIGPSDLTILLNILAFQCGWEVWHGPLFTSISGEDTKSLPLLKAVIKKEIINLNSFTKVDIINQGVCSGVICGGNLSLITGVIGTKFELNLEGKIILLEEVNEPDYKIDAMLFQLVNHYNIEKFKGLIFGTLKGCNYEESEKNLGVRNIIKKYFCDFSGPIIANYSSSHTEPMTPIPLNCRAKLDTNTETINLY